MMNKEIAMRHPWYGLLIAGSIAGCTSSSTPSAQHTVPDHFDDNLDVIARSVSHPCGADADTDGDGAVDVHYSYTYDSLGRSKQDLGIDLSGAIVDQIDYTWDNAGHLVDQREAMPAFGPETFDYSSVYDTLGRRTQVKNEQSTGGTVSQRTTINYSEFDDLGHSAHGDELIEDLNANTTKTLTRAYGYDDLGRRISLDVHFAAGDVFQSWQHAYDDAARTVTTNLSEPHTLRGALGFTDVQLDSYDVDYDLTSTHDVSTALDGSGTTTVDTVNVWDGDRELSSTTTFTVPPPLPSPSTSITFKYQCSAARTASASTPVPGAPHARPMRRTRTVP
jgi:hypothetical protein